MNLPVILIIAGAVLAFALLVILTGGPSVGKAKTRRLATVKDRHAVSTEAAGPWKERLLPLPRFLLGNAPVGEGDVAAGLRLTAHFLARDVFGLRHLALPPARLRLADRFA